MNKFFEESDDKTIRINLNETVKVKLTDWGKVIYYRRFDSLNEFVERQICKSRLPKEDEDGYTEFQLWDFINMYGQYISMGAPNVIEPLEIVYQEKATVRGVEDV